MQQLCTLVESKAMLSQVIPNYQILQHMYYTLSSSPCKQNLKATHVSTITRPIDRLPHVMMSQTPGRSTSIILHALKLLLTIDRHMSYFVFIPLSFGQVTELGLPHWLIPT